jgi:hypothetical protein
MNQKGYGRKRSCSNLRYYPGMPGGTEENCKKHHERWSLG